MLKYWPQLATCAPALFLMLMAITRNFLGVDVSFFGAGWLIGVNVLSFAACAAFALLHPQDKAWRYAALFNAWIFLFALIASILRFGA